MGAKLWLGVVAALALCACNGAPAPKPCELPKAAPIEYERGHQPEQPVASCRR